MENSGLFHNECFAIHPESACLEQSRKHPPMSIPGVAFVLFDPSLHLFLAEKRENSKRKGAKPLLLSTEKTDEPILQST